jgi:hypothetical protein
MTNHPWIIAAICVFGVALASVHGQPPAMPKDDSRGAVSTARNRPALVGSAETASPTLAHRLIAANRWAGNERRGNLPARHPVTTSA